MGWHCPSAWHRNRFRPSQAIETEETVDDKGSPERKGNEKNLRMVQSRLAGWDGACDPWHLPSVWKKGDGELREEFSQGFFGSWGIQTSPGCSALIWKGENELIH
jgi:hypothetical protein